MSKPTHQIEAVIAPMKMQKQTQKKTMGRVKVSASGAAFKQPVATLQQAAWLEKCSPEDLAQIALLNGDAQADKHAPPHDSPQKKQQITRSVLMLAMLFVAFLVVSNVTGFRVIQLHLGLSLAGIGETVQFPAALVVFPMTYLFSTLITEVYGYRTSRLVIWGGLTVNFALVLGMWAASLLPVAPEWALQNKAALAGYDLLVSNFSRTFFASTVAYFCGEFVNTTLLAKLKVASSGKYLWGRVLFSAGWAITIDSAIFCTLLFFGVMPGREIAAMILFQITVKAIYELALLPVTTHVSGWLKKFDKVDYYDFNTRFNPFAFKD
ncbi:queuosine precursor transporter [Paraburkholderia bonniea]|uniref:queuosine precursor transporter n=1 Tax=Paraburkholderia bonniea TaxID=2152891 RepID=UPI00129116D8|nr:queuosine precursor transporter [Paraburkholderia bonniea]WJF90986.1 queuosine precursor transporter [Paraburkholderia bonniea]WJF94300.1 queuosine precursor transporter [Paraburkholderia bonniea]